MRTRLFLRSLPAFVIGAASAGSVASISACAGRSYFDPVYSDTHRWDSREDVAYRRWEAERQFQHVEFATRHEDQQRDYWRWRHDHPDR